jgi:hypothetical protein
MAGFAGGAFAYDVAIGVYGVVWADVSGAWQEYKSVLNLMRSWEERLYTPPRPVE